MICEKCNKKPANCFCTINQDGKQKQAYLCGDCRQEYIKKEEQSQKTIDITTDVFCHNCGVTLKDFTESGYVGCQQCYESFGASMQKAIKNYQKITENKGKVPPRFAKKDKLESLHKLLEQAMINNDLNQVNRISKQIKDVAGGNL